MNLELIEAAAKGDLEKVKKLIADGADINFVFKRRHFGDQTALNNAIQYLHLEIVHFLLEKGADPNALTDSDLTPLHYTTKYAEKDAKISVEIIEALLNNKANINAQDKAGRTPLMWAVMFGATHIIQTLIKHNANLNVLNNSAQSALSTCIMDRDPEGIDLSKQFEMMEILVKTGANINQRLRVEGVFDIGNRVRDRWTPLIYCLQKRMLQHFRKLIELGADVNATCSGGNSPLFYLILSRPNHYSLLTSRESDSMLLTMARMLIAAGAIVDRNENESDLLTTLYASLGFRIINDADPALYHDVPSFKELADIISAAQSLFNVARQYHRSSISDDVISSLCDKGASFLQRTTLRFNTPLHEACFLGNYPVASKMMSFIKFRTDLNTFSRSLSLLNKCGHTPLDEACIAFQNTRETRKAVMEQLEPAIHFSWLLALLGSKLIASKSDSKSLYDRLISLNSDAQAKIFSFLGLYGLEGRLYASTEEGQNLIELGMENAVNSKMIYEKSLKAEATEAAVPAVIFSKGISTPKSIVESSKTLNLKPE